MEILNRDAKFRDDTCQRISSKGKICDITKDECIKISAPFEELRKGDKSVSNTENLRDASLQVRQREIAKKRVLKKEENGGFILISGVTIFGTLAVGAVIFMAIKSIIMG